MLVSSTWHSVLCIHLWKHIPLSKIAEQLVSVPVMSFWPNSITTTFRFGECAHGLQPVRKTVSNNRVCPVFNNLSFSFCTFPYYLYFFIKYQKSRNAEFISINMQLKFVSFSHSQRQSTVSDRIKINRWHIYFEYSGLESWFHLHLIPFSLAQLRRMEYCELAKTRLRIHSVCKVANWTRDVLNYCSIVISTISR